MSFGGLPIVAVVALLSPLDVTLRRGRVLRETVAGMALSLGLAFAVGYGLYAVGIVSAPSLVAITLAATALGLVIPVLKDAGLLRTTAGVAAVAAATVAEFTCITLLSLFFSKEASGAGAKIVLLVVFGAAAVSVGAVLLRFGERGRLGAVLTRLQDTTAEIRVRFAVVLFIAFATLATTLRLETILGAFVAGAMLKIVDRDAAMTHPQTMVKLEANRVRVSGAGVLGDDGIAVRRARAVCERRDAGQGADLLGGAPGGAWAAGCGVPVVVAAA
jgi:Kef-type K+ transport system membrane component KefB